MEATLFLADGAVSLAIEVIWSQPSSSEGSFAVGCRHSPQDTASKETLWAFIQEFTEH